MRPGTHLDLIGAFIPAMRESDNDCYLGTSVFIDTDEALAKAGDLPEPLMPASSVQKKFSRDLSNFAESSIGRKSANEITVYKAVGTALEDLAAACAAR